MKKSTFVRNLKEASASLKKFEAESTQLKEKVAESDKVINQLNKEAEALKIAMDMTLEASQVQEVMDKFAMLKTKDLNVVKEAMNLDLTQKAASLGKLYDNEESGSGYSDAVKAFISVLQK